ncbi:hypothetical protein EX895_005778 [Sporisorium graminicola]|uniref:CN hydrolase domain-containing protein n=1 Tax=Sporisorium graminicola TaxID=280036 RepID=A0A4U7KNV8_9BASI|nr:hypothetical protein EX895_005778 [Sporisorium graminicola]TKY85616.1 hypothetical protein EX895_005778 [Sporisorium graminicola]
MSKYSANSLCIKSRHMARIQAACKEAGIYVSLGFAEKVGESLYMAQALISRSGEIVNKRHKIMPTGLERVVYGNATENSINNVTETPLGRIGHLQCWEHIQPLLKFNTISQGEQIHVAAWPALFPHLGFEPFSMADEGCEIISRTYAIEAQAFVIMSTSLITAENAAAVGLDFGANGPPAGTFFQPPGGGRAGVFAPDGRKLTQTVPADREAIIYCDIDLSLCSQAKLLADPVGHYVRPDLLRLVANNALPKLVSSHDATPVPIPTPIPVPGLPEDVDAMKDESV